MQTVDLQLGEQVLHLPVNFATWKTMAERVCDPLKVALELNNGKAFEPTIGEIVKILHVGISASGSDLSEEEVGDLVLSEGAVQFIEPAIGYLMAFVTGRPAKPVKATSKKKRT